MQILVFLGSVRDTTPPRPARLGARVAAAVAHRLSGHGAEAPVIDPLDVAQPVPFKPHFAYAEGKAPGGLDRLATQISEADGYAMVSPEYNHSISPALAHLLNHFGASRFSFKPSAIVTYSAGQWGGARAAMGMRPFLSELGCLPVSAMVHVPHADKVFNADGAYANGADAAAWEGYIDRTLAQLLWWAEAAAAKRAADGPPTEAFRSRPDQRDAPG